MRRLPATLATGCVARPRIEEFASRSRPTVRSTSRCSITVDSEGKLAEVASAVQANVVEATERMLGLEVGEVNVFVSSVAFAQ